MAVTEAAMDGAVTAVHLAAAAGEEEDIATIPEDVVAMASIADAGAGVEAAAVGVVVEAVMAVRKKVDGRPRVAGGRTPNHRKRNPYQTRKASRLLQKVAKDANQITRNGTRRILTRHQGEHKLTTNSLG